MLLTAFALAVQLQGPGVPADSIERLRRVARRAETEFERLSRRLIPTRYSSGGTDCDEIVGRFCLTYDAGRPYEPGPPHGRIVDARRDAIEALRHVFTYTPGELDTAAPLVRYLVEDDRASEAAATARLFRLESSDTVWGLLLLGFAEHAAGNDTASTRLFAEALERMPPGERGDIEDLDWVLESEDGGAWDDLEDQERDNFAHRFWTLADPLFMTPGNESRNEHVARHVWSRMLERAPRVADMMAWGRDLDQLTVRYGVPTARTRNPGTAMRDGSLTEHFDPDQLAWAPDAFARDGPPPPPLPGRPWEPERTRSRSGYAPVTFRKMVRIEHQATRIPDGDGTILRLDGEFVMDSVAAGSGFVRTALFVLDDSLRHVTRSDGDAAPAADTARFHFEARLPRGGYLFSLEAFDTSTRLAGRARYFLEDDSAAGPRLSDPVITAPWSPAPVPTGRDDPGLRPRARLILQPSDTIGLYAEGLGFSPGAFLDVELSVEPASRASLPARVFSWIGDKLGLSEPATPSRLGWTTRADEHGAAILAVELFPGERDEGDRVIILRVTDSATDRIAESRRIFRVESR
jgi:hypothetical protein